MNIRIIFVFNSKAKKELEVKGFSKIDVIRKKINSCKKKGTPFEYITNTQTGEGVSIFLEDVDFIEYELVR